MPELVISDLSKNYGGAPAVEAVDITVADGEFFTLLGPSGCGKSTTLSCVAGLTQPDRGRIQVGETVFVDTQAGRFLAPELRNLGMVFQSYALWPHMTVADNLAVPLKLRRMKAAERKERIHHALEQVGLGELHRRYPHQLSGGQQQRVALARSLVYSPNILLLDEPLSNLDAKLRDQARTWLKQLQDDVGITTLYVTHDQLEALSLSDRIAVMGDNRVLQIGTPRQIYEEPATPAVAAFVGRCNFFTGVVRDSHPGTDTVLVDLEEASAPLRVPANTSPREGAPVTVAVRSEKLQLREVNDAPPTEENVLRMSLHAQSYAGARFEYQLLFGNQVVYAEGTTSLRSDEVDVVLPPAGCVLFDEAAPVSDAEPMTT